ncbi:hypothetical protein [Devosia ginsengisoli]|uniref:DUF718 domain-containing protein n=1 Tax=Devosia ginsengisoli TaxID=400770 RepID=A0A5B8LTG5_9HYPH|nr:hypothetical protein [Devosia ginsengisoli]QDZ11356.1 hypothetical protein FPZ08_11645 [Devosia ginsengisoli]
MTAQPELQVFVCRLHRDKIALYEAIHDGMTPPHAANTRRGYDILDIYRLDDLLVMLTRRHAGPPVEPTEESKQQAARWHASLAECFAEPWRPAPIIFSLALAGGASTPDGAHGS